MELRKEPKKLWIKLFLAVGITGLFATLTFFSLPTGNVAAQQPTGSVATVTGTPTGPFVTVYTDQLFINVFAGPSSYDYEGVGTMASGTSAPALGSSQDGNWIEIVYLGVKGGTGWVYGPFVSISLAAGCQKLPHLPPQHHLPHRLWILHMWRPMDCNWNPPACQRSPHHHH